MDIATKGRRVKIQMGTFGIALETKQEVVVGQGRTP
jgi:hypothetical protein